MCTTVASSIINHFLRLYLHRISVDSDRLLKFNHSILFNLKPDTLLNDLQLEYYLLEPYHSTFQHLCPVDIGTICIFELLNSFHIGFRDFSLLGGVLFMRCCCKLEMLRKTKLVFFLLRSYLLIADG